MITVSTIMAPLIMDTPPGFHPVYVACAIGSGSLVGSWMNDSGFWVYKQMSGLTEIEALQSWTPLLAIMGVVGLRRHSGSGGPDAADVVGGKHGFCPTGAGHGRGRGRRVSEHPGRRRFVADHVGADAARHGRRGGQRLEPRRRLRTKRFGNHGLSARGAQGLAVESYAGAVRAARSGGGGGFRGAAGERLQLHPGRHHDRRDDLDGGALREHGRGGG